MMKTYKTEKQAKKDAFKKLSEKNPCIFIVETRKEKFRIIPESKFNRKQGYVFSFVERRKL